MKELQAPRIKPVSVCRPIRFNTVETLSTTDSYKRITAASKSLRERRSSDPATTSFWEIYQPSREDLGFWRSIALVPSNVLTTISIGLLSFLGFLAFASSNLFLAILILLGVMTAIYMGLQSISRAHEVSIAHQVRLRQAEVIESVNSARQEEAKHALEQEIKLRIEELKRDEEIERLESELEMKKMEVFLAELAAKRIQSQIEARKVREENCAIL